MSENEDDFIEIGGDAPEQPPTDVVTSNDSFESEKETPTDNPTFETTPDEKEAETKYAQSIQNETGGKEENKITEKLNNTTPQNGLNEENSQEMNAIKEEMPTVPISPKRAPQIQRIPISKKSVIKVSPNIKQPLPKRNENSRKSGGFDPIPMERPFSRTLHQAAGLFDGETASGEGSPHLSSKVTSNELPQLTKPKPKFVTESATYTRTAKPKLVRPSALSQGNSVQRSPLPPRASTTPSSPRHGDENYINIDNFDPSNPQKITDPETIRACKNLGVTMADLSYPTDQQLKRYTKDPELYDIVKRKLEHRADRAAEMVREEMERVARRQRVATERQMMAEEKKQSFAELERARLERIRRKNQQNAEELIFTMLMMNQNEMEAAAARQREEERQERHRRYVELKREEERMRLSKIAAENQRKEREKMRRDREYLRSQEEQSVAFERRRSVEERQRHEQFEETEARRAERQKAAKKMEEEEFEAKQKRYNAKQTDVQRREEQLRRMKEADLMRVRQQNAEAEAAGQRRVEEIRTREKELIAQKREMTELRIQKHRLEHERRQQERIKQIEAMRAAEEQKLEQGKIKRIRKEKEEQEAKERAYAEGEEKAALTLQHLAIEAEKTQQRAALVSQMKVEDNRLNLERQEKQREVIAAENAAAYEDQMRRIDRLERERIRQQQEANAVRIKLEKEKNALIEQAAVNRSRLMHKSPAQLKKAAAQMGVDFNAVQERVNRMRRGRSSLASSVPLRSPK